MAKKAPLMETISLKGLEVAPSQIWGAVRLIPLIRKRSRVDLRLFKRNYNSDLAVVSVEKDIKYISYVPHGLVLHWSDDGSPVVATGGQLLTEGKKYACGPARVQLLHRMVKRQKNALRLLPLHLAMEGFLGMFFNGPDIAWSDYSRQALSQGLSPRVEWSIAGRGINKLEDALRLFEIHENQVGVLLFVSEVLASAFIVPTPEDYRALHGSLIEDFYGETFYYHGMYGNASELVATIDEDRINSLEDLSTALSQMRSHWFDFQSFMASDLLDRTVKSKRVYQIASFGVQRFITDLAFDRVNYIGEAILDDRAYLQYLKIYGLSKAQTKRIHCLQQLSRYDWSFERTAEAQGDTIKQLVRRMERLGFGYLVNNRLREQYLK